MIIKIIAAAIAGALFTEKEPSKEIFVGKGTKSKVVMTGYIGAADVKDTNDKYVPGAYGRLNVRAAKTGEGDKERLVLELDGGLRGVLFKNKDESKNYQYAGNIDAGDGNEYVIFGRLVKGDQGTFISLSSGAAQAKKDNKTDDHPAPVAQDNSNDIPF